MPNPPRFLPALITPFTRAGDLDLAAHRHNVRFLFEQGVRGFVIGGSNGEGPYLEPGERARLCAAARDELGRRVYLMCGLMAETTREAARQVPEAVEGGADAVLVLTPTTLIRNRTAYVVGFFQAVADHSPLPVILYSVPPNTAYSLPEDAVAALAAHPNIVGMKDSSGDPVRLQRLVAAVPEGFLVWSGSSQALSLAVAAGAYGAITGSGNYAPRLALDTLAAALRNPLRAADLQDRLSALSQQIEVLGVPGVKAAAQAAGMRPGHPRAPLASLPRREAARLAALLTS